MRLYCGRSSRIEESDKNGCSSRVEKRPEGLQNQHFNHHLCPFEECTGWTTEAVIYADKTIFHFIDHRCVYICICTLYGVTPAVDVAEVLQVELSPVVDAVDVVNILWKQFSFASFWKHHRYHSVPVERLRGKRLMFKVRYKWPSTVTSCLTHWISSLTGVRLKSHRAA